MFHLLYDNGDWWICSDEQLAQHETAEIAYTGETVGDCQIVLDEVIAELDQASEVIVSDCSDLIVW